VLSVIGSFAEDPEHPEDADPTTLTLYGNSDIEYGTVTIGDADGNENVLFMDDNSVIAKTADVVLKDGAAIVMVEDATANLTINTGDIWYG
jgi:hypothetical protein